MKKITITVLSLLFISSIVYSQTKQIEEGNLLERFNEGDFNQATYQRYGLEWRKMIKEIGGYPELPYDENSKQLKFKWINETGQSKKANFNRILEWAALSFGALSNVLHYKDFESGKIVIKGWFDVTHKNEYKNFWGKSLEGFNTTECYLTYVFTVKDDRIKTEIANIHYKVKSYGSYSSGVYNPDRTIEVPIDRVYPITNFEFTKWRENLDLIDQTSIKIESQVVYLHGYIKNYSNDYSF